MRHSQAIHCHRDVEVPKRRESGWLKVSTLAAWQAQEVAAATLLYKVKEDVKQDLTSKSCTDQLCAWHKSTRENVLPDSAQKIQSPSEGLSKSLKIASKTFTNDTEVSHHLTSCEMAGLARINGTILNHLLTANPQESAENELSVQKNK